MSQPDSRNPSNMIITNMPILINEAMEEVLAMSSYRDRMQAGVYNQAKPTKAALEKAEAAAAERASSGTTTADLAGLKASVKTANKSK